MSEQAGIKTAKEAADHELILVFGRLQGAANRLEYILGRALEEECGISHLMFEVLLILGRAGSPGLSMRAVAQEQVLTTGGATRLVDRMEAAGLVARAESPATGAGSWCGSLRWARRRRSALLRSTWRTSSGTSWSRSPRRTANGSRRTFASSATRLGTCCPAFLTCVAAQALVQ